MTSCRTPGQFVNGLSSSYTLNPESGLDATWAGIPAVDGLAEFGRAIWESIPPDRLGRFLEPDLTLGINNLVVPPDAIRQRMNDTAFRDRALLPVGKDGMGVDGVEREVDRTEENLKLVDQRCSELAELELVAFRLEVERRGWIPPSTSGCWIRTTPPQPNHATT
jgi:hypothetical protein